MVNPPQKQQEQEKGFFNHPKQGPDVSELLGELNSVNTRIRILEERYTNLRRKTQVSEQNMLTTQKNINSETKNVNSEINEIKRDVELIKNKIKQVVVDLGSFAKKDRVKVLEKYIEFIDPTRYVTIDQVEKIIKNILEENK